MRINVIKYLFDMKGIFYRKSQDEKIHAVDYNNLRSKDEGSEIKMIINPSPRKRGKFETWLRRTLSESPLWCWSHS